MSALAVSVIGIQSLHIVLNYVRHSVPMSDCKDVRHPMICLSECPRPRKPKNGYRRGRNFGLGDRVSFGCRFGYDLQGSHESVCRCVGKNCNWQPRLDQTCVAGKISSNKIKGLPSN